MSLHIEEFDAKHSNAEERYITTASHPDDRGIVLVIAWTDRSSASAKVTRIISARAANAIERKRYAEEISSR